MKITLARCGTLFLLILILLLAQSLPAFAHGNDRKPRTPSKALPDLKIAREALDAYKARLQREGATSCCIKAPVGSKVDGCDTCVRLNGSCQCAENLAQGKGVCGECYAGLKNGRGLASLGKVDLTNLKVLPSDQQKRAGFPDTSDAPEMKIYREAIARAKRTLIAEKRYSCCIGRGGCDECAHEGYCACGSNLAADMTSKPKDPKNGVCSQCFDGLHGGHSRLGDVDLATLTLSAMDLSMSGSLGPWSMAREGSGTSWLPESSPMFARISQSGNYRIMQMGLGFAAYTDSGSKLGERQFFPATQYMHLAQRDTGGGTLALKGMISLDPLLMAPNGYPNLFQSGETYQGQKIFNRQHPHDLVMELATSYSKKIKGDTRGFLYLGLVGEPALGPAAFQHRPSTWDNPLSPLSHHWLDSAHITPGVVTAGFTFGNRWKLEGSLFTGREPDENRFTFDALRFDSRSVRLSFNPSPNWSFQTSYARITAPETGSNDGQEKFNLSGHYNQAYANGNNLALTLAFGGLRMPQMSHSAVLLEAAYTQRRFVWFSRFEAIETHEIRGHVHVPGTSRMEAIQRLTLGTVYNFQQSRKAEQGVGASIDYHFISPTLQSVYGSNPVSFTLFYRLRFGRM